MEQNFGTDYQDKLDDIKNYGSLPIIQNNIHSLANSLYKLGEDYE